MTSISFPTVLIILCGADIWGGISIFQIGKFDATVSHVFLVFASILSLKNRMDSTVSKKLFIATFFLLYVEVVHVGVIGEWANLEWMKSYAQLFTYAVMFLIISKARISRNNWINSVNNITYYILLISVLGILLFTISNIMGYYPILTDFRVLSFDPNLDTRYMGVIPNFGLAKEPSLFAVGLVLSLSIIQAVYLMGRIRSIRNYFILVVLVGINITLSLSLTGLLSYVGLILLVHGKSIIKKISFVVGITTIILFTVAISAVELPLFNRLERVVNGTDRSTNKRLLAPLELITSPPSSIELAMLGSGVGIDNTVVNNYYSVYDKYNYSTDYYKLKLPNVLSAVFIYQGYIGLSLFIIVIYLSLKVKLYRENFCFTPLWFGIFIILFSGGYYLSPILWVYLGFVSNIMRSK